MVCLTRRAESVTCPKGRLVGHGFDSILVEGNCRTSAHLPDQAARMGPLPGCLSRRIARELLGLLDDDIQCKVEMAMLEPDAAEAERH